MYGNATRMNAIDPYAVHIHVCMEGVRVPLTFSSYSFSDNKSIYDNNNNMLYYKGFHSNSSIMKII